MTADHYKVLGLTPAASAEEVKAAGRREQLRWHPDRCKLPEAEQRFREVTAAIEVLGDWAARARYDACTRYDGGVGVDIRAFVDVPERIAWTGGRVLVTTARAGVVELDIPAGARPGASWRFPGRGGPGTPPGALIVVLRQIEPDPHWRAEGLDLHGRLSVTLSQVYEGAPVNVDAPSGPVRVRLPERDLTPIRVRGRGLAAGGRTGDLVVHLVLVWPRADPELAAALRRAR